MLGRERASAPMRPPTHEYGLRTRSLVLVLLAPVFLVALPALVIGLGAVLDRLMRLTPAPGPPAHLVIGVPLIVAGAALGLWSNHGLFTAGRGTPLPLMPTQELVAEPPYTWTRNPMALGAISMYLGVAILVRSLGAALVVLVSAAALLTYIRFGEERQLLARFGPEYWAYRGRTPFLLPHVRPRRQHP